jgi:mRNA-degrading endonuclease RelE of RelBE toxin-antitoxin system
MASGLITVAEVDPFPATARRAGLTEEERQEITLYLAHRPDAGGVIQGTGGLRKLRWPGSGKGKRGGYRVIYYFFDDEVPLYLLAIYPKNQQVDLTPQQKERLSVLADALKAEARRRAKARRISR